MVETGSTGLRQDRAKGRGRNKRRRRTRRKVEGRRLEVGGLRLSRLHASLRLVNIRPSEQLRLCKAEKKYGVSLEGGRVLLPHTRPQKKRTDPMWRRTPCRCSDHDLDLGSFPLVMVPYSMENGVGYSLLRCIFALWAEKSKSQIDRDNPRMPVVVHHYRIKRAWQGLHEQKITTQC